MKNMIIAIVVTLMTIAVFAICKCASDKELEKQQQQEQAYINYRWAEKCKQDSIKAAKQFKKDSIACKGDLLKMSELAMQRVIESDKSHAAGNIGHEALLEISK